MRNSHGTPPRLQRSSGRVDRRHPTSINVLTIVQLPFLEKPRPEEPPSPLEPQRQDEQTVRVPTTRGREQGECQASPPKDASAVPFPEEESDRPRCGLLTRNPQVGFSVSSDRRTRVLSRYPTTVRHRVLVPPLGTRSLPLSRKRKHEGSAANEPPAKSPGRRGGDSTSAGAKPEYGDAGGHSPKSQERAVRQGPSAGPSGTGSPAWIWTLPLPLRRLRFNASPRSPFARRRRRGMRQT